MTPAATKASSKTALLLSYSPSLLLLVPIALTRTPAPRNASVSPALSAYETLTTLTPSGSEESLGELGEEVRMRSSAI